jgi:hypothetical protein
MQRMWPCALVTYRSDVRQYVDIRDLRVLLQSNVQNKQQLEFVEFS